MKQKRNIFLVLLFVTMVIGCSKMNDKHDFYLQDGEIIYLGRVDSARILPGENRFLLRYWITDLRATQLKIFWNQMTDSLIVPIPTHQPADSIDVLRRICKILIPTLPTALWHYCGPQLHVFT